MQLSLSSLHDAASPELDGSGTMVAAVYRGLMAIELEDVPIPRPSRGEVLVRVERCGVCHTDLKKISMGLGTPPLVFGHETAGVIVKTGAGVSDWSIGDRVAVFHHVPCRSCYYCANGAYAQCPQYKKTGTVAAFEPAGGGFAQYVLVKDWIVADGMVRLPNEATFDEAALLEPLSTCLKAVRKCGVKDGMDVVVIGQGPIGLMFTGLLTYSGARVVAVEPRADRAAVAHRFGAAVVVPPEHYAISREVLAVTNERGADAVVVTVPAVFGLPLASDIVRPGGTVLLFASTHLDEPVTIDAGLICHNEVNLIGSYSSDITLQAEAAQILFEKPFDWGSLVTHILPLREIRKAIEIATHPPKGALKVLIAPWK